MPLSRLSPRQRDVARLIPKGFTNRQIGQQLSLTEPVVKNYLKEIYDRLGVWNRLELSVMMAWNEEIQ